MAVSIMTTIICVTAGSMAAYALARLTHPWQEQIYGRHSWVRKCSNYCGRDPIVFVDAAVQTDGYWRGLILLYSGFMLPTVIWIMHNYFLTIPQDLEQAAMIDGCSRIGSFVRVVLPLSGPGLVAVSAFTFLSSWNEFFMALIFTASNAKTIPVVVTEFSSQFGTDYGLWQQVGFWFDPSVDPGFLLQRYIVAGFTAGAVKG